MKIVIREGAFETNSSSTHTIVVATTSDFQKWKEGKALAKFSKNQEADNTQGNFWSYMNTPEFTEDFAKAERENRVKINLIINCCLQNLEEQKEKCLNHKKLIEKKLTPEELKNLPSEEQEDYLEKEYEDSLFVFDEERYNKHKESLEKLQKDLKAAIKTFAFDFESGLWITFDEFLKNFKEDCYSTFEHEDSKHDITIFGKYYHS